MSKETGSRLHGLVTGRERGEEERLVVQLIVLGDSGAGKSCLLSRYAEGKFAEGFTTTIGVDFAIKTVDVDGVNVRLQLWDTAGQERFRAITASYYRVADAAMIVYDITKRSSFESLSFWLRDLWSYRSDPKNPHVPVLLVGNKSDLSEERVVEIEEAQEFASRFGLDVLETSAKLDANVHDAFVAAVRPVVQQKLRERGQYIDPHSDHSDLASASVPKNDDHKTVRPLKSSIISLDPDVNPSWNCYC